MFDLLVRMLDETGQEVLPSEFLAAAERTDLMKNIDRWVIGAAMSFCAAQQAAPRVRAPLARLDARPDARHLAAAAAQGVGRRAQPHRVRDHRGDGATQQPQARRARCRACSRRSASSSRSSTSARPRLRARCCTDCPSTTSRSTAR